MEKGTAKDRHEGDKHGYTETWTDTKVRDMDRHKGDTHMIHRDMDRHKDDTDTDTQSHGQTQR